ncbi:phosphate/phosphite/phosphonate ABC transporter substrate-binding protein [Undibacterium rugosum]|uniref:phosphate/phosphite/phosphonate ABC transporter substrate-binding protein n=1 Tax=Undibacterium rugosum TaxID=2762291 RepID=UPI001B81AAA8|nr:phosphate/phosphite/phosphonate ABC transporter substrate-binding protein [Undibacterium rugosum]MBR7779072.1 phosphate/phosphite/phosphonate ABC transporter substrate-binding protein [Undibacterium rugosum]
MSIKKFGLALMLSQTLLSVAVAAEKLTVGLIAPTNPEDTRKRWQPLLDDLAKSTGMEVQALVSANYRDILDGFKNNTVQVAWLSSKVALEAVEGGKASVFAQMIKSDGSRGYTSVLIVPAASPLLNFDQITAKPGTYRFADGDPNSTSGYLVPAYYLFSKNKVEPAKVFKQVIVGNHQANLASILRGEVDVATFNSEEMDRLKKEAPDQLSKIRAIWTSPLVPNDPILYRKDMSAGTKNRIEDFFINYGKGKNPAQRETLKNILNLSGFQRSNDAQLKPIADLALFSILRTNMNDTTLTNEQKQKKFDEVSARFGKLSFILESARLN